MGSSDGSVLGLTKILDNGPDNQRFNIVIVAEGYQGATAADQVDFNNRCQQIVNRFSDEPWFSLSLLSAINIHRLNVSSTDAGADDPATCGDGTTQATPVTAATFFDAAYCTAGIRRCLGVSWSLVRSTITAALPTWHAAVVLVNSTQRGGCASGNVFASALSTDWLEVVMHELGHAAFGLGDEYSTWAGCAIVEPDRNNAPPGEPLDPNITASSSLAGLKWAQFVGPLTPVPTMQNPDCASCDTRANVLSNDLTIGLFEGSGYYHCGYYRPAYSCRMRVSSSFFCRVCVEAIQTKLQPFFGTTPALAAELDEIDFGNLGQGSTLTRTFEISNVGTVPVTGITLTPTSNFSATLSASGASLAPGDNLIVSVTFGPVATTGPQNGTLQIASNAATLTINLRGFICLPQPQMQVNTADGSLTLNFGDVARRLTMFRRFEVRNIRTACPAQLEVTLLPAPAGFSYAPGTATNFFLPAPGVGEAFTMRAVYAAFASPATGGPDFNGTLTVTTPDDPVNALVDLTLIARAVDPPPVDTVLVLDRSGSMSEPTGVPGADKMALAIQAANLYISLLKDNDRIGAVRFNDQAVNPADVLHDLIVAGDPTSGTGRAEVSGVLTTANLAPLGATSIGGGTILGSTILEGAVANSRALIVLTDGIQNSAPDIPTATTTVAGKSPRQRVFAVGLGLNQLEDQLVQIASVTNGVAQITGDLVGEREFLLQKLYVQILSDVSDEAFVRDPVETLPAGGTNATDVFIGEVDVAADFIVVFRPTPAYPKYIQVWLEAPDGTIIRPADAGTLFPNVSYIEHASHLYFRWQFPAFPDRPNAHVGRWRVWVGSLVEVFTATNFSVNDRWNETATLHYSVMCKARSDLRLGGYLTQASYQPGSRMTVVLEPTLYGVPVALDAPVEVRFKRPDGVPRIIPLSLNTHGQYTGEFDDTGLVGNYGVSAEVWATSPAGARVTRYRQLTGLIFQRGQGDGEDGHPKDDVKNKSCCYLGWLAALLLALFLVSLAVPDFRAKTAIQFALAVAFLVFSLLWIRKCRPGFCRILIMLLAGLSIGGALLALLLFYGGAGAISVSVFAVIALLIASLVIIGFIKRCFTFCDVQR